MFSGIPIISRKGKQHILCQCPEDESMYYDLKVQEEENGKTAVCTRCSRLAKKLPEGGQEPLLKYNVFGENKLDSDPFQVRHLPGCLPKKRITEIRESGNCDPDVSIQRSTLSGAKADVLMNTHNVTDVFQLPNDDSDSIVQTAAEENESTSNMPFYPAVVVRKKAAYVYIHRLRKNNRLCYRFRKEKMGVYLYLRCLTCESVSRNKKMKNPICRKFAGSYLLKDAEGDHLPGCKPERYAEVITNYERLQEAEIEQRFVIEQLRKKGCHILFIVPGDDAVVKCYKFLIRYNQRSLSRRSLSVFCSTCYANAQREMRASTPGARWNMKYRRFTVDGFAEDPTLNHRSDCKPLRYSHIMKQHEIVDEETAKQYLNFDRIGIENDDMNDSMPTPKRARLSQREPDVDLTDDTVLDHSTIPSEEPAAVSVVMMRRINMSITVHPMKKCVAPVTGVSNSKSSSSKLTSICKSAPAVITKKSNGIMSRIPDDVTPPQLEQQQVIESNHNRRGKRIRPLRNDADMDLNLETVDDHSGTLEDTEINGNQCDETAGMESIDHEVPVLDESGSENHTLRTIKRESEESIAEIETSIPTLNLISTSSKRIKNEPVNIINESGEDLLALRTPEKKRNSSDVRVMSAYRQYRIHSIFLDANGFSRDEMSVIVDDRSVDVRFKRKTVSPFHVGVVSTLRLKHSVKFPESAQMDTLEAVLEDDEVVLTVRST